LAIAFIRTILIYFFLVIAMRIMGKRQLSELEPIELVVAVLISDLASHPLQDINTPLLYGLIPLFTLVCFEILISYAVIKNVRIRSIICGKPSIIIDNGKIIQKEMKKNRFTLDELTLELRKKNILDINTIKHAILETDGTLSILPYDEYAPLTPKQMNIRPETSEYPIIIINDGRTLINNLKLLGLDANWLKKKLSQFNIKTSKDVYFMTADVSGKIYLTVKEG